MKRFRVAEIYDDEFEGYGFHATRRLAKKHALMVATALGRAVDVIEYHHKDGDFFTHHCTVKPY